jgi:hypothetical protein
LLLRTSGADEGDDDERVSEAEDDVKLWYSGETLEIE